MNSRYVDTTVGKKPTVHYKYGPSGIDRICNCPGSVQVQQRYPEEPSGSAAVEGTHDHTFLEYCGTHGVKRADDYIGWTFRDHDGEFYLDEDRASRVQVALDYLWERDRTLDYPDIYYETYVCAGGPYGYDEWAGTADLILMSPVHDELEVIDYKGGFKIVLPTSRQNISYLWGAINRWPLRNFKTIRSTIIQTRDELEPIKSTVFTREELDEEVTFILGKLKESNHQPPRWCAGDWCKYCRGAKPGRCEVFGESVRTDLNEAFAGVPPLNEVTDHIPGTSANTIFPGRPTVNPSSGLPVPLGKGEQALMGSEIRELPTMSSLFTQEMSNDQIARILDNRLLIKGWLDDYFGAVELEGLNRVRSGLSVPGYKEGESVTQRRWTIKDQEVLVKKLQNKGIPKADIVQEKVRTVKQVLSSPAVEELTGTQRANLDKLIEKPAGRPVLVPNTDPRADKTLDFAKEFAGVPPLKTIEPSAEDNNGGFSFI